jgi:predicted TIM-barrel fold metal-dependent hydrolase
MLGRFPCAVAAALLFATQTASAVDQTLFAQARPGPGRQGPGGPGGPGPRSGGGPRSGEPANLQPSEVPWVDLQIHLRAGPNHNFDEAIASALAKTGRLGSKKIVLVPQPFPYDGSNPNAHDYDVFLSAAKTTPDRLAFLGGSKLNGVLQKIDPKSVTETVKRDFMAEANKIIDDGARGFGELALLHFSEFEGHPYERVAPDHPLLLDLADLGARRNALLAIHMEAVEHDMDLPNALRSPPNPRHVEANIAAFERLLGHNTNARIVWLHNGWDNTGQRTPELVQRLMAAHPNLSITLKFNRSHFPSNAVVTDGVLSPGWLALIRAFPDRVMLGSDSFFASASSLAPEMFRPQAMLQLLARLQSPLKERIAFQNAERIYNLR